MLGWKEWREKTHERRAGGEKPSSCERVYDGDFITEWTHKKKGTAVQRWQQCLYKPQPSRNTCTACNPIASSHAASTTKINIIKWLFVFFNSPRITIRVWPFSVHQSTQRSASLHLLLATYNCAWYFNWMTCMVRRTDFDTLHNLKQWNRKHQGPNLIRNIVNHDRSQNLTFLVVTKPPSSSLLHA